MVGRARPPPGRPAGRAALAGGRLPAADRIGRFVSAATASVPRPAPRGRLLAAQAAAEVGMTLRRGESVLLALGIPVMLLVFFSVVHVLPTDTTRPVDFLGPGILALAVMSTAMVSLGIATGFERSYGVLKRLGTTPLGRPGLLVAKTVAVVGLEAVQLVVLVPVAVGLGWRPAGTAAGLAVVAVVVGTVAFAGLGLLMAGSLKAETTLSAANGLYLVLLRS